MLTQIEGLTINATTTVVGAYSSILAVKLVNTQENRQNFSTRQFFLTRINLIWSNKFALTHKNLYQHEALRLAVVFILP